jgi:hypothetical protein
MVAVGEGLCANADPLKTKANVTTSAVKQTKFFIISVLLFFALHFASARALQLRGRRDPVCVISSLASGPAAAIARGERNHLGNRNDYHFHFLCCMALEAQG